MEIQIGEPEQKILETLIKEGKTQIHNLRDKLDVKLKKMKNHLQTLMRYGLIYNSYSENSFNDKYLHYEISKLGRLILNTESQK